MMFVAILLLTLLFIFGLIHTLFQSQTKKFVSWSQSSIAKVFPQNVIASPAKASENEEIIRSETRNKQAELKNVFATFDKNKDGFIAKQELRESMRNVGVDMSETEVADMVERVDSNGDGLIDLDEFCELFESMVGGNQAAVEGGGEEGEGGGGEGDLKEAFDVFDVDRDGLITVEELGLVLNSLGMKEGERLENCKEMIRKVDVDGDGMVNFDEFKKMMKVGGGRLISVS